MQKGDEAEKANFRVIHAQLFGYHGASLKNREKNMMDMTDKQFDFLMTTLEGRIIESLKNCQTVEDAKGKVREIFHDIVQSVK